MEELVDQYYDEYENLSCGKHSYENDIGCITFIKTNNHNRITLFEIYVNEKYRNQGHCRRLFIHMIMKGKNFIVISVLSRILYDYLLRFKYEGHCFCFDKRGFLMML